MPEENWEKLQEVIGVRFNDIALLKCAFTHKSAPGVSDGLKEHNDQLEFLGDSVLGFVVKEYLFRNLPETAHWQNVRLHALTTNKVLAQVATEMGLEAYLVTNSANRQVSLPMKAQLVEALVAAIYLDQDMEATRAFVMRFIVEPRLEQALTLDDSFMTEPARLQARLQEKLGSPVHFASGNDKRKGDRIIKTATVFANGRRLARGEGVTQTAARQRAAQNALRKLDAK